jgi:hypothetical protein
MHSFKMRKSFERHAIVPLKFPLEVSRSFFYTVLVLYTGFTIFPAYAYSTYKSHLKAECSTIELATHEYTVYVFFKKKKSNNLKSGYQLFVFFIKKTNQVFCKKQNIHFTQ